MRSRPAGTTLAVRFLRTLVNQSDSSIHDRDANRVVDQFLIKFVISQKLIYLDFFFTIIPHTLRIKRFIRILSDASYE